MVKILKTTSHRSYELLIIASTTQTQGQQPLTAEDNIVTTVANTNDVVTLSSASDDLFQTVLNLGANTLQIFPASGDDLGNGVNASISLGSGQAIQFLATDATTWKVVSISTKDVSCKVTKSAVQSIPNNTETVITWNQEDYDTDSMHDNVTNNERITINTAGKYLVVVQAAWAIGATGRREIIIKKNGTDNIGVHRWTPIGTSQQSASFLGDFAVNDFIEVFVHQVQGTSLNFESGLETYFAVQKFN